MKVGDRVRIVAPGSVFHGDVGTIRRILHLPSLELGVDLYPYPEWENCLTPFSATEVEVLEDHEDE